MDERASSKEREETDLHVRRNTAIKISDGHITITPLYIWTVGIWRKRNVTAVGTTEMLMSWCYLPCLSLCSTYRLLHLCLVRTYLRNTHVGSAHQPAQIILAKYCSTTNIAPIKALAIAVHHTMTLSDRQNATYCRLLCNMYTHHLLLKFATGRR